MAEKLSLLEQFDTQCGLYGDFCERLKNLLMQLLRERCVAVHSISARVKARESYLRKISRKEASYQDIAEVTDVAGIRVITYFADQVDEIARIIEDEFVVDTSNSIDKRATLDPDRFGYLSLHYVVSLSASRSGLTEYKAFQGFKSEIQIRSILQHAWAEIEHDLGYKTTKEVPRSIRRRFARLAGLLELADSEFVSIRGELDKYSRDIAMRITEQPNTVGIDRISLIDFTKTDNLVRRLDTAIAEAFQYKLEEDDDSIASDVDRLQHLGLSSIADVRRELGIHQGNIIELAKYWAHNEDKSEPRSTDAISEGISLFYLCHILAGLTHDPIKAADYFRRFKIGINPVLLANELVEFMKRRTPFRQNAD